MRIEKLLRYNAEFRTTTPLYRVVTKHNVGHWAHSRTMALLWFVTTTGHNRSVRKFNRRHLKAKCVADLPPRVWNWPHLLAWVVWAAVLALLLWFGTGCTPRDTSGRFRVTGDVAGNAASFVLVRVTDTKTGREFLVSSTGGIVEVRPAQ